MICMAERNYQKTNKEVKVDSEMATFLCYTFLCKYREQFVLKALKSLFLEIILTSVSSGILQTKGLHFSVNPWLALIFDFFFDELHVSWRKSRPWSSILALVFCNFFKYLFPFRLCTNKVIYSYFFCDIFKTTHSVTNYWRCHFKNSGTFEGRNDFLDLAYRT